MLDFGQKTVRENINTAKHYYQTFQSSKLENQLKCHTGPILFY